MRSRSKALLVLFASLALAAGCATTGWPPDAEARPAADVPERFTHPEGADTTAEVCWNPMTDARDGTRLVMARAREGRGDYEVPAGRYGVGEGELLRLRCATGEVVGIVRR